MSDHLRRQPFIKLGVQQPLNLLWTELLKLYSSFFRLEVPPNNTFVEDLALWSDSVSD